MSRPTFVLRLALALLAPVALAHPSLAATADTQLNSYAQRAGKPASADRGKTFFLSRHGGEWSCSTCHGEKPTAAGQHAVTSRVIKPLAPSANSERFTNEQQTEKWFRRNCNDVLKRECTDLEKADVIAFLKTL